MAKNENKNKYRYNLEKNNKAIIHWKYYFICVTFKMIVKLLN